MSLVGWTPERELLTDVLHAVRAMHSTLIAANSQNRKGPEVPKPRRPRTLVDDLRKRADRDEADRVIALFSPQPEPGATS